MSGKVTGAIWDLELSYSKQLVLLAMADHADHEGCNVFASIGLIAYKTGYSERQVQRIIHDCVEDGILKIVAKAGNHKPTTYRIDLAAGKKKPSRQGRQIVTSEQKLTGQIVTPENDQNSQNVIPRGDTQMSPEPSDNRPNTNTDSSKELSYEELFKKLADAEKRIAELETAVASSEKKSEKKKSSAKRKEPPKPRPRDPLFDLLAKEVFGLEHVNGDGKKVGSFQAQLLKHLLGPPPYELSAVETVRKDLVGMYEDWPKTHPGLHKPCKIEAIGRGRREYLDTLANRKEADNDDGKRNKVYDEDGNLISYSW